MNFPHKLRKLFDPEIIGSMREHIHRAFHPVSARRLQRQLETDPSWGELRRKYPRGIKEVHRFGDTNFWIKRNVERAQDLSLDRGRRRHILDLGCGPGFFLYVAEKLGHTGVGLDIDEQAIFRDTLRLLKVKRVVHCIQPRFHLPAPEKNFDFITIYLISFNGLKRFLNENCRTCWVGDCNFLIKDVGANNLVEDEILFLEFYRKKNVD